MKTTTRPATVAAGFLAVPYLFSAVAIVYLLTMLRERMPVPPELEPWVALSFLVQAVFVGLWAWSAVACARHQPSPVILTAIVLTAGQLVRGALSEIWTSELDGIEIARSLLDVVLVVVVFVWRPRGDARDVGELAGAKGAV